MIQALEDEIEAIKNGGGNNQVPLTNGILQSSSGKRHFYLFNASYELTVPDDTPGQLKVGNKTYRCTVVAVDGFEVTLEIEEDLGPRVPRASLNTSPYFLLELLKQRLEETLAGKLTVNKDMPLRLFNELPNEKLPPHPPAEFPPIENKSPNDEQKRAVSTALCQRITFVWGPPGTGKTTTVKYLVPALLKRGERVLITSHTNTAVDEVLKAAKKGLTEEDKRNGAIVRIGQPKELSPEIEEILLEKVVERRATHLVRKKEELEEQLKSAKDAESFWSWWHDRLTRAAELRRKSEDAENRINSVQQRISVLDSQIESGERELESLEGKLEEARNAGILRRLFAGLNPERIQRQVSQKRAEVQGLKNEKARLLDELQSTRSDLAEYQKNLTAVTREMSLRAPIPSESQAAAELEKSQARVKELETQLEEIRKQLAELPKQVIREARVVGATLSKIAVTEELYTSSFENVIADEVSMTPQPHLWFCSSLATQRVVLLGDFRQLPPICIAGDSAVAAKRIAKNIYEEAGIIDQDGRVSINDPRLCTLRKQYRMHACIGELANKLVYEADGNALIHDPKDIERGMKANPESGTPLVLVDTSQIDPWCARQVPGFSRYNIYSAMVAVRLAEQAATSHPEVEVGIISPYAAQARLLHELVKERDLTRRVKVATVHRFQGGEKDVIIVDLVDGKPFKPGFLLTQNNARCFLNVAFTRAKGKLILVSNREYFSKYFAENSYLGNALQVTHEYFSEHVTPIESQKLVQGFLDPEFAQLTAWSKSGLDLGNLREFTMHTEASFYPAFLADLESAKNEVIIFSPFVYEARTSQLVPALRALIERGVSVYLVTRPPKKRSSEEKSLIQALQELGITVVPRDEQLHEKFAFIDECVAWFGSLNIMSHSRTTDFMVRFNSQAITGCLMEFSRVRNLIRKQEQQDERNELLQRVLEALLACLPVSNCPTCGTRLVLRHGRFGPFFACPKNASHKPTDQVPRALLEIVINDLDIRCPDCGSKMRLKSSKNGLFLGCSGYPQCRKTVSFGG